MTVLTTARVLDDGSFSDPVSALQAALSTHLTTDALDVLVKDCVSASLRGEVGEGDARQAILGALFAQGVHESAVDAHGVPSRHRDEIVAEVYEKVSAKVLDRTGKGFDFKVAMTSSACAWVRRTSSFAAMQKVRDHRCFEGRNGVPIDPISATFNTSAPAVYDDDPLSDLAELDQRYEAFEAFSARSQATRGMGRIRCGARLAHQMYAVALAVRPECAEDRDWLFRQLGGDRRLAHRSLVAFRNLVVGQGPLDRTLDERLLALWDDYSVEMAESLVEVDSKFAHMVAMDAVAPWTRPAKRHVQHFRSEVAQTMERPTRTWRSLTIALAASFVDHEFAATSDFVALSDDDREAARKGHVVSRSRFDDLVGRAAAFDGFPLGATADAVRTSLFTIARQCLESEDLDRFAIQRGA